jgi:hypothetical protein
MVDNETEKNILIRNDLNVSSLLSSTFFPLLEKISTLLMTQISKLKKNFLIKFTILLSKRSLSFNQVLFLFISAIIQQILISFHRQFIRLAFSDKIEKIREDFCKMLILYETY